MLAARYMGRQCRRIRKILVAISQSNCFIPPVFSARVAELVDAHDSGSCVRKDVEVRFLSRAPLKTSPVSQGFWGIQVGEYPLKIANARVFIVLGWASLMMLSTLGFCGQLGGR